MQTGAACGRVRRARQAQRSQRRNARRHLTRQLRPAVEKSAARPLPGGQLSVDHGAGGWNIQAELELRKCAVQEDVRVGRGAAAQLAHPIHRGALRGQRIHDRLQVSQDVVDGQRIGPAHERIHVALQQCQGGDLRKHQHHALAGWLHGGAVDHRLA